jgi:hypothetical protein
VAEEATKLGWDERDALSETMELSRKKDVTKKNSSEEVSANVKKSQKRNSSVNN